jgi:hypothetical protein
MNKWWYGDIREALTIHFSVHPEGAMKLSELFARIKAQRWEPHGKQWCYPTGLYQRFRFQDRTLWVGVRFRRSGRNPTIFDYIFAPRAVCRKHVLKRLP